MLLECLSDKPACSKWLVLAHVFQVLQIPGEWSCTWRAMMAMILRSLQIVLFQNLGSETGPLLFPYQASTGGQPQGTAPSWRDQVQDCDASAFGALLCAAFFSSSWPSPMSHSPFPSHFKLSKCLPSASLFPLAQGTVHSVSLDKTQPRAALTSKSLFSYTQGWVLALTRRGFALNFHVNLKVQG